MDAESIRHLAAYIDVLMECAGLTTRAEDRSKYERHLSEAAELLPKLVADDASAVAAWVDAVARSFGIDYLSRPEGAHAEAAFSELSRELRRPA